MYSWTNSTPVFWSQLYQTEVVTRDVEVALSTDSISGISLWQFCDTKVCRSRFAVGEVAGTGRVAPVMHWLFVVVVVVVAVVSVSVGGVGGSGCFC